MKKQYSPMSVDVVKFEAEDVITVSRLSVDPTTPTTPTRSPSPKATWAIPGAATGSMSTI